MNGVYPPDGPAGGRTVPRALTLRRRALFAVVATLLGLLAIEAGAGLLLRVVDFDSKPKDQPEWLVAQLSGVATGTYLPDPHTIWRLNPGVEAPTTERGHWGLGPLLVNEHGMRGPSVTEAKPEGVRRALVVGGSHPMGMYVDERGAYSRVLERRLAELPGARWEVLNAAVAGHTTWQGLQFIRHHALRFAPDVVIFDLGINDDLPLAVDWAAPDHEVTAVSPIVQRLVRLLDVSAAAYLARKLVTPLRRAKPEARRVSRERGLENLRAIGELAREEGFEVLYMQQVSLIGEGGGSRPDVFTECVREYEGFEPRVDLCPRFTDLGVKARSYFVDLIHANEAGHAVIADAIAEEFVAQGWAGR